MDITSKIWIIAEQRGGKPVEVTLETIAKAKEIAAPLNWPVAAVVYGAETGPAAKILLTYGVDEVIAVEHELLADYCNQTVVKALEGPIRQAGPEAVLVGATALGVDLAARLAARLKTGLSAHCIDLELTGTGDLLAVVPGWGGSVMAKISCPAARPQMATVMPGVFPLPQPGQAGGRVIEVKPDLTPADATYRIVGLEREEKGASALETAEVIVAGGWGVGQAEEWKKIKVLAETLGGAVGATRPAVDEGWADEHDMIGTSGATVRPKLYIGVGLSGHVHHLVGVKGPELMIGINSNPEADIFDHCDIGLVGDFKEIVPALIEKIEEQA